jgi:hypothetical protein
MNNYEKEKFGNGPAIINLYSWISLTDEALQGKYHISGFTAFKCMVSHQQSN